MAKRQQKPEPFVGTPVEKCAYLQPFTLSGGNPNEVWTLADYDQQNITDDGALCPDKPILVVSNRGSQKRLPWGSLVGLVDRPEVKAEVPTNEGTETEQSS